MLEPIKEMPTLASAGPNVEMTLEKMPVPEQSAGDDEGNSSGAVAEENSIEHQLNAAKSWGNGGANNNAEDSKFVGSFAFVNASHSPNGGAWEHKRKWQGWMIDFVGFANFLREISGLVEEHKTALQYAGFPTDERRKDKNYTKGADYLKMPLTLNRDDYAKSWLQCSQSVVLLLLIYAKENGLPVYLKRTNSSGQIMEYNSMVHSEARMLEAAKVFSPKDLKSYRNTVMLSDSPGPTGTLQITDKHAAVSVFLHGSRYKLEASGTLHSGYATFRQPRLESSPGLDSPVYIFNIWKFNSVFK